MPPSVAGNQAVQSGMEIAVQKSDLLKELSVTWGIVERKSTVPILTNFLLEASGNSLLLTATDLDLSLRTFCVAKVIKPGACTIPARKLYEYARLIRDGEITIKLLENHWVQIRSGRSNTKMVGMEQDHLCHLAGRVAIHIEWRLAADKARVDHHGCDRWAPFGTHRDDGQQGGRQGRNQDARSQEGIG